MLPHVAKVDFARQADRKEIRTEQDENEIVNVIDPKVEPSKIKGVPFSRLTSVKLVPLLRESKIKEE